MAKNIELKIATPDALIYESAEVRSISVPTTTGEVTILHNHIPLLSPIKTGALKIKKEGEELYLSVSGGTLEVRKGGRVVILADRSEMAHLIDIERAELAYERARQIKIGLSNKDALEYARINSMLEKELNRIKIGKRFKNR